jgi:hypothetical protein
LRISLASVALIGAALVACEASRPDVVSIPIPSAVAKAPPAPSIVDDSPAPSVEAPAPPVGDVALDVNGVALAPHAESLAVACGRYTRCVDQQRQPDRNAARKVMVKVTVGVDGRFVRATSAPGGPWISEWAVACALGAARALEFEPPAGGKAKVDVAIELTD